MMRGCTCRLQQIFGQARGYMSLFRLRISIGATGRGASGKYFINFIIFLSVYSIPHSELEPGELWWLRLREDIEEALALINIHAGDDLSEFVGLAETVVAAPQQLNHREREELGEVGAVGAVLEDFAQQLDLGAGADGGDVLDLAVGLGVVD